MAPQKRLPRFLVKALFWFVALFMIDTACTIWLWHEPYSPVRTLGYSLFVAFVFVLPDHLFDLFAGRSRGANETSHV